MLFAHYHAAQKFMDDSDFKDKKKYVFDLGKELEKSILNDRKLKETDETPAPKEDKAKCCSSELSEEDTFKIRLQQAKKRFPMTIDDVISTLNKSIEHLENCEDPRGLV